MGKSRLIPTALILTLLAGLGWAAVYTYDKGFTKRWRQLIMDELSRRGIEAKMDKLTFDPFEGLVARNVRIFEDEKHRSVLATINNITLDIDLARLVRKEQFLNTIDLRDADISFPIDPKKPDGDRIEISNFSARIQMPDETIDIQKAEFEIGGLIVSLRGALLQPTPDPDAAPDEEPPDTRKHRQFISDMIGEIEKFHVAAGKPRLDVEIFGDLDKPEEIEAKLELRAAEITRKNYYCDRLEADIEFKYPNILLDRLLIADRFGELHGHAQHSIGGDSISFDVESSIDSHTLLRSILNTREFGEVVFYGPPKLEVEGEYFIGEPAEPGRPPVKLFGNAACGRFISRSELFEGFHVDFAIDREKMFFRNLLLEHKTGTAEAKILYSGEEEGMRFQATVDLSPKIFSLFIDNRVAKKMIERFDFDRSPNFFIRFEGHGPARDRATWRTEGNVSASNFRYNGTPVKSVVTNFELSEDILTFTDFRLDREEGFISGEMAMIDPKKHLASVRGVRGTIDPVPTTRYFAPKVADKLVRYRFAQPPTVTLDGDIATRGSDGHDFTVTFETPGEAGYTFLKKPLPLSAPRGEVRIVDSKLNLDLDTQLFGGDVHVLGDFNLKKGEKAFDATVTVDKIDFGQLADTYELKTDTEGEFTGNATLSGQIGSFESISAKGAASIFNGNVFAIPVLGPISRLINRMMPEKPQAGYSVANEASAKLQLEDGKLRAEEFQAIAGGFKLKGEGTVDFIADDIDFNMQMNVRGAPGVVLFPVSRLFKYKGEGPISDPRWRPVNFTLPRGDGPGLLGGPGILPRNREPGENGAESKRPRILENGIPIVRPLRKGITKGVIKGVTKGGEAIKSGGEKILSTGEKILGKEEKEKAPEASANEEAPKKAQRVPEG